MDTIFRIFPKLCLMLVLVSAAVIMLPAAAALSQEAQQFHRELLQEDDPDARHSALEWLSKHGDERAVTDILDVLQNSDAESRKLAEMALWAIWGRSGDRYIDDMLATGSQMLASARLVESIRLFDEIIRLRPDFAEGYNKRATALYYMGEFERSMVDIEATLRRNPYHFGALSGAGLVMIAMQRPFQALTYIERALAINPNMASMKVLARKLGSQVDRRVL